MHSYKMHQYWRIDSVMGHLGARMWSEVIHHGMMITRPDQDQA